MARVSGHDRHAMNECSGANESISIQARSWNVECSASLCHSGIDSQDAASKSRQHVRVHPRTQDLALLLVATLDEKNPNLQFQDRDYGQVEA